MWLIYASLSALTAAGVAIVAKLGLKGIDTTLAATLRSLVMFLFLFVTSLSLGKFTGFKLSCLCWKDWVLIAVAGVFSGLSWLFYFLALKTGRATSVVAIDRLSIAFVFIFAILFLSEHFSLKGGLGVIFMTLGAILLSTL